MKFKSMYFVMATMTVLATLSGCGKPVNSVDFYLKDQDSRITTMQRCQKLTFEQRKNDQDCNNARIAIAMKSR